MQIFKRYNSDLIRDILIGFSDGLVIPFALVAGLTVAGLSGNTILISGIILIIVAAVILGISGYLTEKEELKEVEDIISKRFITGSAEIEDPKTHRLFNSIGLPDDLLQEVSDDLSKDHDDWNVFREQLHPNLVVQDTDRPVKAGLNIAFAYVAGGLIPVSPFYFIANPINAFYFSAVLALTFSLIWGFLKNRVNGLNPFTGALKSVLITAAAGGGAILVAYLF